jgi:ribose transport system permease protein
MKKELGISALLVVLAVTLAIMEPNFLRPDNIHAMLNRISMYGIFSIGCGIVIITGGIDLSIGSVFALLGVVLVALLRQYHWPWMLALLAVTAGSMGLGALHGLLVTKIRLQPFIVTLCGLLIYRSQARYLANEHDVGFGKESFGWLETLTRGRIPLFGTYDIPAAFMVLLAVAAIMWVVLHWSIYGRYLFAVGRNEEAARFSGINTKLVIGSAYVVAMILVAIAGILFVFDIRSVTPTTFGQSYELYGIAAAVLGGCSLRGGEGSILGIVLGAALLQLLMNLVNLLNFPSCQEGAVMGVVILIGVMFDQFLASRKRGVAGGPQPSLARQGAGA